MNEKDTAALRRFMKPDQERLKMFDLLNVYVMKETNDIYHVECRPFAFLERDEQVLFLNHFRKTLTGAFDHKLFELKFRPEAAEGRDAHARDILWTALQTEDAGAWADRMMRVTERILGDAPRDYDRVITFARGEFYKPVRRRDDEPDALEDEDGLEAFLFRFLLCTVSRTEQPPKTLVFDYVEKAFKPNLAADPVINLAAPEAGFLFPCLTDDGADVNHVLYAAGKANMPDWRFAEDVLDCEPKPTALQDRELFADIVQDVAGGALPASTLARVYDGIHQMIEEHEEPEPPMLDARDVERILADAGVDGATRERVEDAFRRAADDVHYELKATSVIPKYTGQSVKIKTKVAAITLSPQDLPHVRQVVHKGRRYLMIELEEDAVIEGIAVKAEELEF